MGLRENNEEGTMQGKERRQFPEDDPQWRKGKGRSNGRSPGGKKLKELTLGGLRAVHKVGSMSFCRMALEVEYEDGLTQWQLMDHQPIGDQ